MVGGPCDSAGVPTSAQSRREILVSGIRRLVLAIEENDDDAVHDAVLRLSRSRRLFAPLAFVVGAFAMLFQGLRLLVTNWRLTLIQILPAMWIWLAMYDLKAHVLHGKSFNVLRGAPLIPINLAIIAITAACFFLNAVFALAIARSGPPMIQPAFEEARRRAAPILTWGAAVGVALGLSTTVVTRYGPPWFTLSLGIVVGVMMICYVAVPARLIGRRQARSRREKLATSALGATLSATVCTPPYLLGRLGLLMLGSQVLRIPGVFLLVLGFGLHAGATGAVRAIKMSASLAVGGDRASERMA
jgi:hypothetical protein